MVSGVAQLDGRIYVLCDQSQTITVYDDKTFVRQKDVVMKIKARKAVNAYDIAACKLNHCLYVTDINNRCILKLTDGGRTLIKWMGKRAWVNPGDHFICYIFIKNNINYIYQNNEKYTYRYNEYP